jgi:hypothetical protein
MTWGLKSARHSLVNDGIGNDANVSAFMSFDSVHRRPQPTDRVHPMNRIVLLPGEIFGIRALLLFE